MSRMINDKIMYKLFLIFFLTVSSAATAEESKSEQILEKNATKIAEIEKYLNGIKNLSADFVQETSEGKIAKGKFYLSRPGKMRVEYNGEPQVLVVVNDSVLSYHDLELDEISNISTNTTPASFLTRSNISFAAKDVEITEFREFDDKIKISVLKKNRKEAGEFSIIFSANPIAFVKMEVKNDLDQLIVVTLSNLTFPERLASRLFVIKNKNLPQ